MKRAIAGKRGSVRGAPPDVYVPFGDFTGDDDESVRAAILPAVRFFTGLGIILVLVVIGTALGLVIFVLFCLDDQGFPK